MHKRIIIAVLAALTAFGSCAALVGCDKNTDNGGSGSQSDGVKFAHPDDMANGTILQAFSWDFKTITNSMADIAAAGFSAVQTSPINECLVGEDGGMELYGDGKWYYHYQPTDFKIGNYQLGTRDEFIALCKEADKYGIKVLVDVIANHTTPDLKSVSQDLIDAGGGSLELLYHKNNSKDITDYSDRLSCTTAKMGGLPDINTERPSFQEYFLKYINDCIACGADGFRYDTAKHIGLPDDPKEDDGFKNNFWERVTKDVDNADKLFIYGEVLQGGNDRLADYIEAIGRTTASAYGSRIRGAMTSESVSDANFKEYWVGDAPLNIVTWVESHDNYINDGTWMELSNDQVITGWTIIAARKDGTPLFFSRPYGCSQQDEWGMNRIGAQGDDMYKDPRVRAANFFRTAMVGEDEKLFNPNNDSKTLMIERGNKGALIVNTTDETEVDFETGLKDGTYIDRIDNKTEFTVKGGKLTCDSPLKPNSVVILYNEGYKEYAPCANTGIAEDTAFHIEGDSTTLTLTLENAEQGKYTFNGETKDYKDGDKLTVNKPADGNVATIELTAENSEGTPTYERVEITFVTNYEVKRGAKVYFEAPENWGDKICAYVYNRDGDENLYWPGCDMTKESDGRYSYTLTEDWENPQIIFNNGEEDGAEQYPAQKGLEVVPDKTYKIEEE